MCQGTSVKNTNYQIAKQMKLNVGVLTMHRVINFGSVLQAYATQVAIERLGHNCTLIDYIYPNSLHIKSKVNIFRIYTSFVNLLHGFPNRKQKQGINTFIKTNIKLTSSNYDYDGLKQQPPLFDKYVVGSDQTWNTTCTRGDDSFLLNFTDSPEKIAYASCAARAHIEPCYEPLFRECLNKFKSISVRDNSTKALVKSLTGQEVPIVLDPTLLLHSSEWNNIAKQSDLRENVKGKYILVYILSYAYDPYPYINSVISQVVKEIGLPLVVIRYSMRYSLNVKVAHNYYEGISPEDFVWLFANASFVITTSFHGTAFAINYNKPFYTIYNPLIQDDRIYSLLKMLGCESSGIPNKGEIPQHYAGVSDYTSVISRLDEERLKSEDYLIKSLKK